MSINLIFVLVGIRDEDEHLHYITGAQCCSFDGYFHSEARQQSWFTPTASLPLRPSYALIPKA